LIRASKVARLRATGEQAVDFNAFIVDWTMADYSQLQQTLADSHFAFAKSGADDHLRVAVPFPRVQEFASICQKHLNAPCNYVDVQYPAENKTILVFQQRVFVLASHPDSDEAREWALSQGLPPSQADWATSF
jgi:hypothetical protein